MVPRLHRPADAFFRSVLDPQSDTTRRIEGLWWLLFGLGTFVVVFVIVALVVGTRRNSGTESPIERRDDHEGTSRRWILGAGVIAPAVIIGVVFVATVWSMRAESQDLPDDALVVEVTGHQWWWEVTYPEQGVTTANELHIPAGRTVAVQLRSADVIHSFWVPSLAGKLDALPERTNTLRLEADEAGRYEGQCAEFCGLQHANMDFVVISHDAADFDDWIDTQRQQGAAPQTEQQMRGADLFVAMNCGSCHTIAGVSVGAEPAPDLTHVASRESIVGGMLDPTAPDLRSWISDPHTVKPGALMPTPDLTDDELDAIVAYIEGLR